MNIQASIGARLFRRHSWPALSGALLSTESRFCGLRISNPRCYSSGSSQEEQEKDIVFYSRSSSRWLFPRAMFGLATFHSAYWVWYAFDFIPAINSSPIESLHVSPTLGYVGLTVAFALNGFAALYPLSLVSKMSLGSRSGMVQLWVHELPLAKPSSQPLEYPLGDVYLDPTASETKRILDEHDGFVELFRGIIVVYAKERRFPLLLEVREDSEAVQNPDIFMQAMLNPDKLAAKNMKQRSTQPRSKQGRRHRNQPKR